MVIFLGGSAFGEFGFGFGLELGFGFGLGYGLGTKSRIPDSQCSWLWL